MTLYHETFIPATQIERFDSFYAYVETKTSTGCILSLQLENGKTTPGFAFGNFNIGDHVIVTVNKTFDNGRYPRVSVDAVISYADNENANNLSCAA